MRGQRWSDDIEAGIPAGERGCVCAHDRQRTGSARRVAAQQKLTQADILKFDPLGTVTILYVADNHAQLMPLYFREPSVNLGVGADKGLPPHLTDDAFRKYFNIAAGSADAYALTADDFVSRATMAAWAAWTASRR
jgi:hypothetical protein